MIENLAARKLRAGGLAVGFVAHQLRGAAIPIIAKSCGYDWIFVDLEHSSSGDESAMQMCAAALSIGITPIIRMPEGAIADVGKFLDHGAMGIVAPHVDTATDAAEVVAACKFPPEGRRSWIGAGPAFGYAPVPPKTAQPLLNRETLICVQIETRTAVVNAAEIAAVPGVDVLLVGTGDLTSDLGVPGEIGHPAVQQAYRDVTRAAHQHGKILGMGGVYDEEFTAAYVKLGARFLLGGADQSFLIAAASQRSRFLQALMPRA